ncbi:hypothetical protein F183_A44320 [Bryobacterales bacterium F-183]|nr:hypothetical protein F183_A44320 [Bryobacterales bacterium F-183]
MGHYTAMGVTGSNLLQGNFESGAAVWVRVKMDIAGDSSFGLAELRTRGVDGPSVAVRVPLDYNGFNHVEIVVDPVALRATATVAGVVVGTLPIPAGTTRYVGFEGTGGADNLVIRLAQ